MYIITNRSIFNTADIPEITCDGQHVLAVVNGKPRPISFHPEAFATIANGLRDGRELVEVE